MKKILLFILLFSGLAQNLNSNQADCDCYSNNDKLITAVIGGNQKMLETQILNSETNINYQTNLSWQAEYYEAPIPKSSTALHLAIISNSDKYITTQLNHDGNLTHVRYVEEKSKSEHRLKIINFLLSQPNIDINLQDENGNTPLMQATRYIMIGSVRFKIIKHLLEKGAIVDIKNNEGKSFLDYAAAAPEIKKIYQEFSKTVQEKAKEFSKVIKENVNDFPLDLSYIISQYLYYCPPLN